MSMLKEIIVHVAIASVLLGSLKKAGVITYETRSHSFCLSLFRSWSRTVLVCVFVLFVSLCILDVLPLETGVYTRVF